MWRDVEDARRPFERTKQVGRVRRIADDTLDRRRQVRDAIERARKHTHARRACEKAVYGLSPHGSAGSDDDDTRRGLDRFLALHDFLRKKAPANLPTSDLLV